MVPTKKYDEPQVCCTKCGLPIEVVAVIGLYQAVCGCGEKMPTVTKEGHMRLCNEFPPEVELEYLYTIEEQGLNHGQGKHDRKQEEK